MIKPEMIPDAVAHIAYEAYYDTAGDNPTMSDEDIMKHAISAALAAWPGVNVEDHAWAGYGGSILILPLHTANPNAES